MVGISISALVFNRTTQGINITHFPDTCPICNYAISISEHIYAYLNAGGLLAQLVFRCPRVDCQELFISYYIKINPQPPQFCFKNSLPRVNRGRDFSQIIKEISANFCEIYNQSLSTEEYNLLKICGGGYRKSLEYLIKDYLIKKNPNRAAEVKRKFLGKCIMEDVENPNLQKVAKRAAWLGNDEAHYLKTWEDRDLQDLKQLIDLTINWIEMEELTEQAIKDMPDS